MINPLVTDPLYLVYMTKTSISKKDGIIEKISYERRAYESVDDRLKPLLGYVSKINGKRNSGTNGLNRVLLIKRLRYSIAVF